MRLFKKVPPTLSCRVSFFVLPSASRASLTSFGTAHRDVLPRRVSAEGPLACLLGATKKGLGATSHPCFPEACQCRGTPRFARGDKKGVRGDKKKGFGATKKGVRGDKKEGSRDKKKRARGDKKRGSGRHQEGLH